MLTYLLPFTFLMKMKTVIKEEMAKRSGIRQVNICIANSSVAPKELKLIKKPFQAAEIIQHIHRDRIIIFLCVAEL